ncbi:hypothetical protein LMG33818_002327 [Halomonadaceae bacterium LMG 33818]
MIRPGKNLMLTERKYQALTTTDGHVYNVSPTDVYSFPVRNCASPLPKDQSSSELVT